MRSLIIPGRGFATPRRLSRLLFAWEAADGSLTARTGQVGAFARTDIGRAIDSAGRIRQLVHSQPRWNWIDTDGDGVREPHLLLEGASSNLFTRSEEFDHADWTKTNATVSSNAITAPDGTLTADRIVASSTASTALTKGVVVAATKATMSVFVKQSSGPTTANRFGLHNSTTAQDLIFVDFNYLTGAITYLAGSTGARAVLLRDGWWWLEISATSGIISGNTITGYVGFGTNPATSGDALYAWGAQLEPLPFATSYIKRVSSAASRVADSLSFPFLVPPRALTIYARFVESGTVATGVDYGVVSIGASVNPAMFIANNGASYSLVHVRGSVLGSTLGAGPAVRHLVELRGVLNEDGSVQLGQSLAGAAEVVAAPSAANARASAWNDTTLMINSRGGGAYGYNAFQAIRIAAGVRSLDYMRRAG